MNNHELTHAVETAMDLIIDGRPAEALASLWCLHREIRDVLQIDVPNDQPRIYADELTGLARSLAMSEARASVALDGETYSLPPITPSRHETPEKRDERLAKDRERKRIARQGGELAVLPPMKPINGSEHKTANLVCPTCKAKPGQSCMQLTHRGRNGKPVPGTTIATYHTARTRLSQSLMREQMIASIEADA